MPLRAPRRLPKVLRRPASPYTRSVARKFHTGKTRTNRRRQERFARFKRRMSRLGTFIALEFKMWLIIGISAVVLTTGGLLLFAPFFDVREIVVRRQDPRIDIEDIQDTLSPLFNQRLALVTQNQVTAMLKAAYPDISDVDTDKDYPSTLNVTVFLEPVVAEVIIDDSGGDSTPAGSGSTLAQSGSTMHAYLTRGGQFVQSPVKLGTVPLPKLTITDWGIRPQNRTPLLSDEFLQTIFLARDTLRRDFGFNTLGIMVYVRAREFHIRTDKVTLWFDLTSSLPVQFQRFREFLKNLTLDQAKQYVDLRIGDKIIYQ